MLSVWLSLAKGFPKDQPHHLFSGMEWVPNASFGGILHHPSSYDCSPSWISRWTGNNSNEDPASGYCHPFLRIPGLSQSFSGLGILCSNDSLTICLASLCQLYSCHVSSLVLEAKDCCATRNLEESLGVQPGLDEFKSRIKLEQFTFWDVERCSRSHSSYLYNRKPDEPHLPFGKEILAKGFFIWMESLPGWPDHQRSSDIKGAPVLAANRSRSSYHKSPGRAGFLKRWIYPSTCE